MALAALPDPHARALDGILAAEDAPVRGVLGDLHLLDQFTQRGTVPGTVLSGDSDLLRALSHNVLFFGCDLV